MKKFFLFFLIVSNHCWAQQNKLSIQGNIDGLGNDTVYVWRYLTSDLDKIIRDTIVARKNHFHYEIPLDSPAVMAIIPEKSFYARVGGGKYMPQGRFIELFVVPHDSITVTGKLEPYYLDYLATGSAINEEYSEKRKDYKIPEIEIAKIVLTTDSLSAFPDTKEKRIDLFNKRVDKQNEVAAIKVNFLKHNPGNDISAYYLTRLSQETFAWYYPMLTENVMSGFFKNLLDKKYDTYLKYSAAKKAETELTVGKAAPGFELKDLSGRKHSLSDFKGKLIVLDFWGSWCGPCISELPKLKSLYDSLKTKVSFIGIACNDTKEPLTKVIREHQLSWLQLMNEEDNDISVLYGIQAFPTKIILDKDLRVIHRFVGVDEDFYTVLRELTR